MNLTPDGNRSVCEALLCAATVSLSWCALMGGAALPAHAQGSTGVGPAFNITPQAVPPAQFATAASANANAMIAQALPGLQPIDLTPVRLPERDNAFSTLTNLKTNVLYKMPAKMFFTANVENSLRLETNSFQTRNHQKANGVYRVIPDVTVGYSFTPTTRVAANYFMFRDSYFEHAHSLSRTVHSVGARIDHDIFLRKNWILTTTLMDRELFITRAKSLHDVMPSVSMTKRVGEFGAVYGSVLGQLRWQDMIGGKWQEGDQFYSMGGIYRRPMWNLSADATLIDNFGRGYLRPGPNSNHLMVLTLEAGRRLSPTIPLVAFIRAQPIFNFGADKSPGYAGFNLRLFGGLRLEISKPAIFPMKLQGM